MEDKPREMIRGNAYLEAHAKWVPVFLIDRSKQDELDTVRVMWRDERGRRVTSFVAPHDVDEFIEK